MATHLGTNRSTGGGHRRFTPDLPIALRPAVDFPPAPISIFDDPGDEKSWHKSQRSESLERFYAGREPSWYASAIAPLKGAERVLDLGCGPGLALEALAEQGASSVWGVDRWPAFTAASNAPGSIIAHDLTLPIPFLASGSFDAILSHYALDYLSPIGMRQVLREARRLLVPGGRLLVYVAAVGLGSRDETRTAAYAPPALGVLLEEAGFDQIDVEAPADGRNSVAMARCPSGQADVDNVGTGEIRVPAAGETQLSASLSNLSGIELELIGAGRSVTVTVDVPDLSSARGSPASFCARLQKSAMGVAELGIWTWRGLSFAATDLVRLGFAPEKIRLGSRAAAGSLSTWSPGELSVEPPGNAYVRFGDLRAGSELSEAERGAEGRQVVVESAEDVGVCDIADELGPGRNRFLIKRAARVEPSSLDREWLAGRAHGVAFDAEDLDGERMRELLLWAGWRQALVFVTGRDWPGILTAVSSRRDELLAPIVMVDPSLSTDGGPRPLPGDVSSLAREKPGFFVLLSAQSRAGSSSRSLAPLRRRLLHGGDAAGGDREMGEATEALRYLTERTLLVRLRQVNGRSPAEVGRRPMPA